MSQFRLQNPLQAAPAGVQGKSAGSRARNRAILGAAVAAAVLGLIWYATAPSSGGHGAGAAPPVRVATAQMRNVAEIEHTIGSVVANATVNVGSQVDGKIQSTAFKEGDIVHKGDVLFRLDPRPFEAALEQARANLARDQAQLVSAQRDRARYDTLFRQNAISAQQRDQALAQAGALTGSVEADKAAVDLARLNLSYAVIRAPVDGKTGPIAIQPGNLVKANSNTLVVINQIRPIKVSFSLPQSDLPRLQKQMAAGKLIAKVTPQGAGATTRQAPVDFINNNVNEQTGTIELRATFPNIDERLVPGELVEVAINLADLPNAIVVPSEAVNVGPEGRYVYVVDKEHLAHMQPVTVLYDDGTNSAVRGKIVAGDTVITVGQLRVAPDGPVSIVDAPDGKGASSDSTG